MQAKLLEIRKEIEEGISSYSSSKALYEFRKSFLDNREGKISLLMKMLEIYPYLNRILLPVLLNYIFLHKEGMLHLNWLYLSQ